MSKNPYNKYIVQGSKYGTAREQVAKSMYQERIAAPGRTGPIEDDEPHGLTRSQIAEMNKRLAEFEPRIVGGDPRSQKRGIIEELLKDNIPGATLDPRKSRKTAQVMGTNLVGNGGSTMVSPMRPMMPEFDDPTFASYPVHRCLLRGTLVQYESGRVGPIEDVEIGDVLLGPDGRERRVLSKWSEGTPAQLARVRWSNGRVVHCTPNHVWPTTNGDKRTDELKRNDKCHVSRQFNLIENSDTLEHARLAGYYAAEGNTLRNNTNNEIVGTRFSLHIKEDYLEADIKRCALAAFDSVKAVDDTMHEGVLERNDITLGRLLGRLTVASDRYLVGTNAYVDCRCICGATATYSISTLAAGNLDSCGCRLGFRVDIDAKHSSRYVCINSLRNRSKSASAKQAAKWLSENVGEGGEAKTLSERVMHWPLELKREFLIGYLRGDGSKRLKPFKHHPTSLGREVSFNTISFQLGWQVSLLAAQCGFPGNAHERAGFHDSTGVWHQPKVEWRISGERAGELARLVWPDSDVAAHIPFNVVPGDKMDDDFSYVRVREVEIYENKEELEVYDLTVSDDHCYCLAGGLVTHNSLANKQMRLMYKMDSLIGTGIDLISELCFGEYTLTGEGVDGEIKDLLDAMDEETQVKAKLPEFVRERYVTGETCPHLYFDDDKGYWVYLTLHNPDQLEVVHSPFIRMDPIVEYKPDAKLREMVTNPHPMLQRVRESMPDDLVRSLTNGENIPLSPINFTFIPRKLHDYDVRGTSVLSRLWRVWNAEIALWNSAIQTWRRAASPIKALIGGDLASGYIPSPEQEKRMLGVLAQAENDSQAWIAVNAGWRSELWGAPERAITIAQNYDLMEKIKLTALGINKALLVAETSYSSAASGLSIFLQKLLNMRQFFESRWLIPKYYKTISKIHKWVKPRASEISGKGPWVRTKRSSSDLMDENRWIVPRIEWAKKLDPQIDSDRLQAFGTLEQLGVKVSKKTKFAAAGLDYREELKQIKTDTAMEKEIVGKDVQVAGNAGIMLPGMQPMDPNAMGGGGGGMGGMPPNGAPSMSPGLPPGALGDFGPPPGEANPMGEATPAPETAPGMEAGGAKGKPVEDANEKPSPMIGLWEKGILKSVRTLFSDFDDSHVRDDEPWYKMLEDSKAAQNALKTQDEEALWDATQQWLLDEGYPTRAITELEDLLTGSKKVTAEQLEAYEITAL